MSYNPPSIDDVGLPAHINALKATSNGCGWHTFDLCMSVGMSNASIGRLFNKHRKTIASWRRHYNEGGYNVRVQ